MERKRDEKEQLNPNLPVIKQPSRDLKYNYNNYQRPVSRERELSRNKSIELARQESVNSNKPEPKRIDRPSSRERLASLERASSKEGRRNGAIRYQ